MTILVACDYHDDDEEEEEDKAGRGGAQRGTTFLAVGRNRKFAARKVQSPTLILVKKGD